MVKGIELPKLTIRPYEGLERPALSMRDLSIQIDGQEVKGLRKLTVWLEHDEVNVVDMEFVPGELDVDLEALQEIQANIEKSRVPTKEDLRDDPR